MLTPLNPRERSELIRSILNTGEVQTLGGLIRTQPCNIRTILATLGGTSTLLGTGEYGQAYGICLARECNLRNSVVLKKTRISALPNNPFVTDNAEIEVLKVLQFFLLKNITPHLPFLIADFICPGTPPTAEGRGEREEGPYSGYDRYYVVERGQRTLHQWFEANRPISVVNIRVILFQLIWTLASIQEYYPLFRHNDLNASNFLVLPSSSTGYTRYTWHDRHYDVPNIGIIIMLNDFGFSSIFPNIPNYKAAEMVQINAGVGLERNRYADMWKLLYHLHFERIVNTRDSQYAQYERFMQYLIPPEFYGRERWFDYGEPRFEYEYRLPRELLPNEFFAPFQIAQATIQHTYTLTGTPRVPETTISSIPLTPTCADYPAEYLRPKTEALINPLRNNCPRTVSVDARIDICSQPIRSRLSSAVRGRIYTIAQNLVTQLSSQIYLPNTVPVIRILQDIASYHLIGVHIVNYEPEEVLLYSDLYVQILEAIYRNNPLITWLYSQLLPFPEIVAIVTPFLS